MIGNLPDPQKPVYDKEYKIFEGNHRLCALQNILGKFMKDHPDDLTAQEREWSDLGLTGVDPLIPVSFYKPELPHAIMLLLAQCKLPVFSLLLHTHTHTPVSVF